MAEGTAKVNVTRAAAIRGFYAIVDLGRGAGPDLARRLGAALLDGGAGVLQLRMKGAAAGLLLACARALRPLCHGAGAPLIINDRLDVALATPADGVQLGQDDVPAAAARRLAPELLLGVSTHDLGQARAAVEAGADYVGFGPVFPTRTKERSDPVVGLVGLAAVCAAVRAPVVAIGGITLAAVPAVLAAGAAAVAAIGATVGAEDVRAATAAFVAAGARGR
jgi:thiamine-phosphate pyrophosphorylase